MSKYIRLNGPWHAAHRMPKNPTEEQRIAWHLEHDKHCKCRKMPRKLAYLMRYKARKVEKAARVKAKEESAARPAGSS